MKSKIVHPATMTWIEGYPSELVEVSGKYEGSDKLVRITIPGEVFHKIAAIMQYTDHVGHAFYHYNNLEVSLPCWMCRGEK